MRFMIDLQIEVGLPRIDARNPTSPSQLLDRCSPRHRRSAGPRTDFKNTDPSPYLRSSRHLNEYPEILMPNCGALQGAQGRPKIRFTAQKRVNKDSLRQGFSQTLSFRFRIRK